MPALPTHLKIEVKVRDRTVAVDNKVFRKVRGEALYVVGLFVMEEEVRVIFIHIRRGQRLRHPMM